MLNLCCLGEEHGCHLAFKKTYLFFNEMTDWRSSSPCLMALVPIHVANMFNRVVQQGVCCSAGLQIYFELFYLVVALQ